MLAPQGLSLFKGRNAIAHDVNHHVDKTSALEIFDNPSEDIHWKVILLCTEENSYMQMVNPYPNNGDVIDITVADDFTSETGYQKVAKVIRENPDLVALWLSFPCTGVGFSMLALMPVTPSVPINPKHIGNCSNFVGSV